MTPDPLLQPCSHLPTPAERQRDPDYRGCGAVSGEPCLWARRYDGLLDPPCHSERLHTALDTALDTRSTNALDGAPPSSQRVRELILDTGLV